MNEPLPTRLIICRGLPASGKTTRAKAWVAEDTATRARVNKDDLRAMIHDRVYLGERTENVINAARNLLIERLLKRGVSVVSDDTNLPQRVARDIANIGRRNGATLEIWDFTNVPAGECVDRDIARKERGEPSVGDSVIWQMSTRYLGGKRYPLPFPDEPHPVEEIDGFYTPHPDAPKAIMVDIDGTIALKGTRSPFDETRVHEDRPNQPVIEAVGAMHKTGHQVLFCSGRTDGCRDATLAWLQFYFPFPIDHLYMRAAGDMRKDSVVKREIFDAFIRGLYNVVCVFDDRNQVVEMWRKLGLTVMQVAPGDF